MSGLDVFAINFGRKSRDEKEAPWTAETENQEAFYLAKCSDSLRDVVTCGYAGIANFGEDEASVVSLNFEELCSDKLVEYIHWETSKTAVIELNFKLPQTPDALAKYAEFLGKILDDGNRSVVIRLKDKEQRNKLFALLGDEQLSRRIAVFFEPTQGKSEEVKMEEDSSSTHLTFPDSLRLSGGETAKLFTTEGAWLKVGPRSVGGKKVLSPVGESLMAEQMHAAAVQIAKTVPNETQTAVEVYTEERRRLLEMRKIYQEACQEVTEGLLDEHSQPLGSKFDYDAFARDYKLLLADMQAQEQPTEAVELLKADQGTCEGLAAQGAEYKHTTSQHDHSVHNGMLLLLIMMCMYMATIGRKSQEKEQQRTRARRSLRKTER